MIILEQVLSVFQGSVGLYIMIFFLKMIEVSVAVVRIILITRGQKLIGSFLSFFELLLWLFLVTTVLIGITEDPIKALVYAAGFAVGQFIGTVIESKIALGNVRVEAIVIRDHEDSLATILRDKGYAITTIKAQGMVLPRSILLFYVPRKRLSLLVKELKIYQKNVVITVEDIKPIYGGYRKLKSRRK